MTALQYLTFNPTALKRKKPKIRQGFMDDLMKITSLTEKIYGQGFMDDLMKITSLTEKIYGQGFMDDLMKSTSLGEKIHG